MNKRHILKMDKASIQMGMDHMKTSISVKLDFLHRTLIGKVG